MYCPNCGAQNSKKQNFCRYCGLHLQEIEKAFAGQLVFGDETKRLKQLRAVRRTTDAAQFFSSVIFLVGILSIIFFDSGLGKLLITAGLLSFFIAQAIRSVSSRLQSRASRQNVGAQLAEDDREADVIQERDTNRLIEDRPFMPVRSVTENTTRQLHPEPRKRK